MEQRGRLRPTLLLRGDRSLYSVVGYYRLSQLTQLVEIKITRYCNVFMTEHHLFKLTNLLFFNILKSKY